MKKIFALMLVFTLLFCFAGCEKSKSADKTDSTPKPEQLSGGWTVPAEFGKATMPEEAQTAFETAAKEADGKFFVPVAYLGRQVVAGMNFAYLCTTDKVGEWHKVTIYRDLDGKCTVTDSSAVDITTVIDSGDLSFNPENLCGGWNCSEASGVALPDDAQAAFDLARGKLTDVNYTPLACLGTQVVAGTNYAVLCRAESTAKKSSCALCLMKVYADLAGGSEAVSISNFPF